jgi:hypothetical protein
MFHHAKEVYRPSGLFAEPAHFSEFASMLTFLNSRFFAVKIKLIIFTIIAMLLSTSTIGLIIAFILLFRVIIHFLRGRIAFGICCLIISIIVLFSYIILNPQIADQYKTRITLEGSSAYIRVLRGFKVFHASNPIEKGLGTGLANVGILTQKYDKWLIDYGIEWDKAKQNMNAIGYDLLSLGFFQLIFWYFALLYILSKQARSFWFLPTILIFIFTTDLRFGSPGLPLLIYTGAYLFPNINSNEAYI